MWYLISGQLGFKHKDTWSNRTIENGERITIVRIAIKNMKNINILLHRKKIYFRIVLYSNF